MHEHDSRLDRITDANAWKKVGMGASSGIRVPTADAILTTLDEALKRLHASTEELAEKLQPLNGERPTPEPGPCAYPTEGVSYAHASSLMTGLEDRARQIDEVAARLGRICARTEL
jgi:hypothetical protein